ncbi:MAG: class I SAM-dependent methyltransferase [Rubrivivax sp.]|jgi:2-polyprenyl-3-methyl-5-hydroxy-6-metoxy-1,4-benzoquinol methylase|nr:class I SAM-dependent methyltransferase [Rubrivivax sp.]
MTAAAEHAPRDLAEYTQQYRSLPFEPIQIEYRRRLVLQKVRALAPARLLEVGCGERPLFLDLPNTACTVVEPTAAFAAQARQLAGEQPSGAQPARVVEGFLEDFADQQVAGRPSFDMIVASCVLHEVPDPRRFLSALRRLCGPGTVVHVNVPNARSVHRLLAVAMGLIDDPTATSDTQRTMQQRDTVYDLASLRQAMAGAGLDVATHGSLFVKPFTHRQMQQLVDQGFMTRAMLDGLDRLVKWMPEMGSELWVHARANPAFGNGMP